MENLDNSNKEQGESNCKVHEADQKILTKCKDSKNNGAKNILESEGSITEEGQE